MKTINLIQFAGMILLLALSFRVCADTDEETPLTIADPYIEMHTGPGSGYPIFYVIDRGEKVIVLRQKTIWFKIRAENGKEGWASKQQMQQTLLPDGQKLQFKKIDQNAFFNRQWELGVTTGKLEDAPIITVYSAYNFTENFAAELSLGQSVGNVSSSSVIKMNLLMQPFPQWAYSPFFTLGYGAIQVKPNVTLVEPEDKNNEMSQLGFGFKTYLSRQFILRFELNEYIIFSANNDKDENEDISEWKLGFAVFF